MILAYLWRYPPYIILLIMVDLVSGSYPPVYTVVEMPNSYLIPTNPMYWYLHHVGIVQIE